MQYMPLGAIGAPTRRGAPRHDTTGEKKNASKHASESIKNARQTKNVYRAFLCNFLHFFRAFSEKRPMRGSEWMAWQMFTVASLCHILYNDNVQTAREVTEWIYYLSANPS